MVEPTESESKAELDRFVDAMIAIRGEIRAVEEGRADRADNVLKHAPHTAAAIAADDWPHRYRRKDAAYPVASLRRPQVLVAGGARRQRVRRSPPLLQLSSRRDVRHPVKGRRMSAKGRPEREYRSAKREEIQ